VQGHHVVRAGADVAGVGEGALHRGHRHSVDAGERRDAVVKGGWVALGAGHEAAAREVAAVGAERFRRNGQVEPLGLERVGQPRGADLDVREDVRGAGPGVLVAVALRERLRAW